MNQERVENIFSSTGGLGVSRRQNQRLYVNGNNFADNPGVVIANFGRLMEIRQSYPEKIGRCVYRTVASNEVVEEIVRNGQRQHLEVALPINEFTNDNSWLLYMANNDPSRSRIVSQETMIEATSEKRGMNVSPETRINYLRNKGMEFITRFGENEINDIYELWSETFGWTRQEIRNLSHRLGKDNVWFCAAVDQGRIVSLAMAERLTIPASGRNLELVESTEWRSRPGYSGKGSIAAVLAILNSQILESLPQIPLIYAECNFQSRSDRAGRGAGFEIPRRDSQGLPAPQILVQNVNVDDGQIVPEGKLRDFTFMYLPSEVINTYYHPEARKRIINLSNR